MSVFDESKHPRDDFGRFTEKGNGRKSKRKQALDVLRKRLVKIDLQFFTEKAILKQTSKEIISGIETQIRTTAAAAAIYLEYFLNGTRFFFSFSAFSKIL